MEPEPSNLDETAMSEDYLPPENYQSSPENHVMDSENHLPDSQPSSENNLSESLLENYTQETSEPPSENHLQELPQEETTPPDENTSSPPTKKRRRRKKQFPEMIPSAVAVNGLRVLRPHHRSSIYNEKLMDEIIEMQINDHTKSRRRKMADLAREVDVEALIALSVGFPVDSLTEEEIEHNVVSELGGVEQANYIVVRNHILARWRSNVTTWLSRDHALESIRSEHRGLKMRKR